MEAAGHDIFFSESVKKKIAKMEKEQEKWLVDEVEDEMDQLLQRACACLIMLCTSSITTFVVQVILNMLPTTLHLPSYSVCKGASS